MDCKKKTKEACKASRKCTYASGKTKGYCKKKNTTKSLCVKKSKTKCKRVRGCKFASGTKRQFCRKNVTKRRKKIMKGGAPSDPIQEEQGRHNNILNEHTTIVTHTNRINELERGSDPLRN
jgi:hypothetical protein